jgi:hypothetical protein
MMPFHPKLLYDDEYDIDENCLPNVEYDVAFFENSFSSSAS